MTTRIVGKPRKKKLKKLRVRCEACDSKIEYEPEDVETYSGTDYSGGPDGYERVKCPRKGCPGYGYSYIERW